MAANARRERATISEAEAAAWKPRKGKLWRRMTEREAREWDKAQAEGDRRTLERIKLACGPKVLRGRR